MRPQEAALVERWMRDLDLPSGSVCLNIGSSTAHFRDVEQPHVGAMFTRLQEGGLKVVHCDLKEAAGVDAAGDVFDSGFQEQLRNYHADVLLCSNLLEHLEDPKTFARACSSLVKPGGHGIFTVPRSYPYHPDPIDTLLRPTPEQLGAILEGWHIERGKVIECGKLEFRGGALAKYLARVAMPFYRPAKWPSLAHHALWLVRKFRQTVVLARNG